MDAEITDEELVRRCQSRRDDEAFAELVRRYREAVFRIAASVLGPAYLAEAEEVAQEVFLRVHRSLKTFRAESKFSSWIYRIAFNQALNLKARSRFKAPHLDLEVSTDVEAEEDAMDGDPIRDQVLGECVLRLPEVYQSVLRLHYWMEYTVAEIGGYLSLPENTVKSYLFRARRLLRAHLENRGYTDA